MIRGMHQSVDMFKHGLVVNAKDVEGGVEFHTAAWRQMKWIRNFENQLRANYEAPFLTRCPIHYCIGQEGVPAYLEYFKSDGDYLFCNHRNHGYFLTWCNQPVELLAELMGKQVAPNKGRAGSQEISMPKMNFHSGAILGTLIGIAAGTAFGLKLNGDRQTFGYLENGDTAYLNLDGTMTKDAFPVVYCQFGDGAADEGIFWEAMNFIALNDLPMVLLCENNGYATFSPQGRRQARPIWERVQAFGIPVKVSHPGSAGKLGCELMDARRYVKQNRKPIYVEHFTYRHCAHVGAVTDDTFNYRPESEREIWGQNDDLTILEEELCRGGTLTHEMIYAANEEDKKRFENAWEVASQRMPARRIQFDGAVIRRQTIHPVPCEDESTFSGTNFKDAIIQPY